jgi:hypothetical protein
VLLDDYVKIQQMLLYSDALIRKSRCSHLGRRSRSVRQTLSVGAPGLFHPCQTASACCFNLDGRAVVLFCVNFFLGYLSFLGHFVLSDDVAIFFWVTFPFWDIFC